MENQEVLNQLEEKAAPRTGLERFNSRMKKTEEYNNKKAIKEEIVEEVVEEVVEVQPKKRVGRPRVIKTTKPNEVLYLAVDSNYLRDLAYFTLNKNTDEVKAQNYARVANNIETLKYFRMLVEEGLLKIVVPTTVYQECKHINMCKEYITKYCVMPKIDYKNFKKYATEMTNLANAYCFELVDINGNLTNAMHPQYVAAMGEKVPTNDAFIMAESTMLGLCLITLNAKDFIQTPANHLNAVKGRSEEFNDIVRAITIINKRYGYVFDSRFSTNLYTSARPISPEKFMEINRGSKNLNNFVCPKPLIKEDGEILEKED